MIVRVAVVPHPPLLVPEVAAGAAAEIAPLRNACLAVARVLARHCPRWVAIAVADPVPVTGEWGTFAGYGADVQVTLDPDGMSAGRVELSLPLLIAGWLRAQVCAAHITVAVPPVAPGSSTAQCRRIGTELAQPLRREGATVEAWQVAAAAAESLAPAYRGELLYSAAPYGVAYHVALWDAVDPDAR